MREFSGPFCLSLCGRLCACVRVHVCFMHKYVHADTGKTLNWLISRELEVKLYEQVDQDLAEKQVS